MLTLKGRSESRLSFSGRPAQCDGIDDEGMLLAETKDWDAATRFDLYRGGKLPFSPHLLGLL